MFSVFLLVNTLREERKNENIAVTAVTGRPNPPYWSHRKNIIIIVCYYNAHYIFKLGVIIIRIVLSSSGIGSDDV